jgi:hypothetical protein
MAFGMLAAAEAVGLVNPVHHCSFKTQNKAITFPVKMHHCTVSRLVHR